MKKLYLLIIPLFLTGCSNSTTNEEIASKQKSKKEDNIEIISTTSSEKKLKKLTSKEVEDNLEVKFKGVSGRGEAIIDNLFDSNLDLIKFEVQNNGKLRNGENAQIIIKKGESMSRLEEAGYELPDDFDPVFVVSGLSEFATSASDIKNLEDIKRLMDEEVRKDYKDNNFTMNGSSNQYDISLDKLMYRELDDSLMNSEDDEELDKENNFDGGNNRKSPVSRDSDIQDGDGNLIGIYTIEHYNVNHDGKKTLEDKSTVIYGYSDLLINEDNKVNITEIIPIKEKIDDSYSLETTVQQCEGYGYKIVKIGNKKGEETDENQG